MTRSRQILSRLRDALADPGARPVSAAGDAGGESRAGGLRAVRLRLRVDDLDWLAAASSPGGAVGGGEGFYWSHPAAGVRLLGLGVVRVIEARGPDRFRRAAAAAAALWDELSLVGDPGSPERGPLLLGGFAFADGAPGAGAPWSAFAAARLVLPEIGVVARDGGCWLSVCFEARDADRVLARVAPRLARLFDTCPGGLPPVDATGFDRAGACGMAAGPEYRVQSDRSHADYRAQVDAARAAIAAGDLEKVVLARSLRVRFDGRFDLRGLLQRLSNVYPDCATFAVARPGACFLGATPELLVARRGRVVRSSALAGSAPRGRTPEEDARRGRALRESKKEQEEHAIVVRAIGDALAPVCESLCVPEAPGLLRLEGIQHLHTPVEGTLADPAAGPSLIALAERLHPTPAVGGAPRARAVDWIARCEGFDRGWYAAPLGYLDRAGDGELRVALRSALVRHTSGGDEALLFAGGGIVSDSDPDCELEETRIKLRALLAPLTEI